MTATPQHEPPQQLHWMEKLKDGFHQEMIHRRIYVFLEFIKNC